MKTKSVLLAALAALAANAAQMATENWVSNRLTEATAPIRESVAALNSATQTLQSAVGSLAGNVYTKQETDDRIVELAPAPGNYEIVSNRAMSVIQAHQTLKPSTNYTDRATNDVLQSALRADAAALSAFASTGAVSRSATYGTPTRWTDATGCVWEATLVLDRWNIKYTGLPDGVSIVWNGPEWVTETDDMYYSRIGWYVSNGTITPEYLGNDASATTFVFDWSYYDTEPHLVRSVFSRPVVTNAVGRVAMTSDIPDTSGYTTPEDVTAAIREQSLGGIWDEALQVWWTPRMRNGSLTYEATTNVNLNAEN